MPNPITIGQFKTTVVDRASFASRRNVRSAVQAVLSGIGLTDKQALRELFSAPARAAVTDFLERRKKELADSAFRSQRSIIRKFLRSAADVLGISQPASFGDHLRAQMMLQGERPSTLHWKSKIPLARLYKFLRSATIPVNWRDVEKLEKALRVEPGTLSKHLPPSRRKPTGEARRTRYQTNQRGRVTDPYYLKELPPRVESVIKEVVEFRTAAVVPFGMKRDRDNVWRINEEGCPSEQMLRSAMRAFYGFLVNKRGFALKDLSIGQLLKAKLYDEFLNFVDERAGKMGRGASTKAAMLPPLFKRRTGFFWQQPKYRTLVRRQMSPRQWQAYCEELAAHFTDVNRELDSKERRKARDPRRDLEEILKLPDPTAVLRLLLERMLLAKPAHDPRVRAGIRQAEWARNCLLVRFLNWIPLRSRNWRIMTYRPDNTGHLYQQPDGSWWMRFSPHEFKPKARKQGHAGDFDVRISETLWDAISEYLTVYRPRFSAAGCGDIVFCSGHPRSQRRYENGLMSADRMSTLTLRITRAYLPEYPGFAIHAWRHIVATSWLKKHPNQWGVAAHALNDSWEMVRQRYSHLNFHEVLQGFTADHDETVAASPSAAIKWIH